MWKVLSGGCRTGFTLKKLNHLDVSTIHLVGGDAAAVWLVEDGVHQVRLAGLQFGPLREVVARDRQGTLPWKSLLWCSSTRERTVVCSFG